MGGSAFLWSVSCATPDTSLDAVVPTGRIYTVQSNHATVLVAVGARSPAIRDGSGRAWHTGRWRAPLGNSGGRRISAIARFARGCSDSPLSPCGGGRGIPAAAMATAGRTRGWDCICAGRPAVGCHRRVPSSRRGRRAGLALKASPRRGIGNFTCTSSRGTFVFGPLRS